MLKTIVFIALVYGRLTPLALAQEPPSAPALPKTQVQVNFLNSCRPAHSELEEMGRALELVKDEPIFSADYEISRGLTTLTEAEERPALAPSGGGISSSRWVRIRKEFPEKAVLTNAQYSLSVEGKSVSEVLALHLRDRSPGENRAGDSGGVLQILISDSVSGNPASVVKSNNPPDRVRIERFGRASIVLARCGGVDQSAYQPFFIAAGEVLRKYKDALAVKSVVPSELVRLPGRKESKAAPANH